MRWYFSNKSKDICYQTNNIFLHCLFITRCICKFMELRKCCFPFQKSFGLKHASLNNWRIAMPILTICLHNIRSINHNLKCNKCFKNLIMKYFVEIYFCCFGKNIFLSLRLCLVNIKWQDNISRQNVWVVM